MKKSTVYSILLAISLSLADVSQHNPYCFSKDPIRPQFGMFSWLTSYDINRGRHIDPTVSSCTPSKFWMLTRHGTRLPDNTEIESMLRYGEILQKNILRNYEAGRTSLCTSDLELIRNWQFDVNITDHAMYLSASGWKELEGLGQRYQIAFPTLLPPTYFQSHYFFKSSDSQRTIASIRALADGFFGHNGFEQVEFEEPDYPDYLLRPHYFCSLSDDLYNFAIEHEAFAEGPEYQEMLTRVSAKLGFHGSNVLRRGEVEVLYKICVYEQTWYPDQLSSMCTAFSVDNHEVLEYYSDLQFYYRLGYGQTEFRSFLENFTCHIMQDLLEFLRSANLNDQKARLFNSHIGLVFPVLVSLGVSEDEIPLTRHNFAQQTFRLWKTSHLLPMAANIAVIRYE